MVTMEVRTTCLLLLLPILFWFLSIFIVWSSCFLVNSMNYHTSFQNIPLVERVRHHWLLLLEINKFLIQSQDLFNTGIPRSGRKKSSQTWVLQATLSLKEVSTRRKSKGDLQQLPWSEGVPSQPFDVAGDP